MTEIDLDLTDALLDASPLVRELAVLLDTLQRTTPATLPKRPRGAGAIRKATERARLAPATFDGDRAKDRDGRR